MSTVPQGHCFCTFEWRKLLRNLHFSVSHLAGTYPVRAGRLWLANTQTCLRHTQNAMHHIGVVCVTVIRRCPLWSSAAGHLFLLPFISFIDSFQVGLKTLHNHV